MFFHPMSLIRHHGNIKIYPLTWQANVQQQSTLMYPYMTIVNQFLTQNRWNKNLTARSFEKRVGLSLKLLSERCTFSSFFGLLMGLQSHTPIVREWTSSRICTTNLCPLQLCGYTTHTHIYIYLFIYSFIYLYTHKHAQPILYERQHGAQKSTK